MKKLLALVLALILAMSTTSAFAAVAEKGVLPITTEPATLTIGIKTNASVTDYEDNYFTKYLEEAAGVKIEWVFFPSNATEARQKIDLMVAGNQKLPDILLGIDLTQTQVLSFGAQGVLLDLTDYINNEAYYLNIGFEDWCSEEEKATVLKYNTAADGKRYAFPFYYADPNDQFCRGLWINQEWLKAVGKEMPTTTDELYDVLVAFRDQDPNGNGIKDEIPLIGSTGWSGDPVRILLNSFIYYSTYYLNAENGVLSTPFTDEDFREGLRYVHKLCAEGLLSPLSFTQGNAEMKAILENGDDNATVVGCFSVHVGVCTNYPTSKKMTEYVGLAPMVGPKGLAYAYGDVVTGKRTTFITRDCADPLLAFRFLDAMCKVDISMSARFGEEGVDWNWADETSVGKNRLPGYNAVYVTTDGVWSNPGNRNWHNSEAMFIPPHLFGGMSYTPDYFEADDLIKYNQDCFWISVPLRHGKCPEEVVGSLIYTQDEMNEVNEIWSAITSYVNESVTRFVTGDLDIEKDWDKYIKDLNAMGLDYFMSIAQTAYTRMCAE